MPNLGPTDRTINLREWVEAQRKRLRPALANVLEKIGELSAAEGATTSRDIRQEVGYSQQKLNRCLHSLEDQGLLRLENQGPGLPLAVRLTSSGRLTLGQEGGEVLLGGQRPPVMDTAPARPLEEPDDIELDDPDLDVPIFEEVEDDTLELEAAAMAPRVTPKAPEAEDLAQVGRQVLAARKLPTPLLKGLTLLLYGELKPKLGGMSPVSLEETLDRAWREAQAPGLMSQVRQGLATDPDEPQRSWSFTGNQPPQLSEAAEQVEAKLKLRCHNGYRHLPWYERTRVFCTIWDQMRKKRTGSLGTFFSTFQPLWEHQDWDDFNQARRMADAEGQEYGQWLKPQFDDHGGKPAMLHAQLVRERRRAMGHPEAAPVAPAPETAPAPVAQAPVAPAAPAKAALGVPPYAPNDFNSHNPAHVEYVQRLMGEMEELARAMYGDDPQGPAHLAVEAVRRGGLPLAALDLRPVWKAMVLNEMQKGRSSNGNRLKLDLAGGLGAPAGHPNRLI